MLKKLQQKLVRAKRKDSQMWQLCPQNISRQTIGRIFLAEKLTVLKKTGPGQIRTQDPCRPRRIRYH